jgi:hypothetical protein
MAGGWGVEPRCRFPPTSTVNISPGHKESYWLALCVAMPQITMATLVMRLTMG